MDLFCFSSVVRQSSWYQVDCELLWYLKYIYICTTSPNENVTCPMNNMIKFILWEIIEPSFHLARLLNSLIVCPVLELQFWYCRVLSFRGTATLTSQQVRCFLDASFSRSVTTQIARFMGPTWGPPGSCRPQVGPMLAPQTLLSGQFKAWPRKPGHGYHVCRNALGLERAAFATWMTESNFVPKTWQPNDDHTIYEPSKRFYLLCDLLDVLAEFNFSMWSAVHNACFRRLSDHEYFLSWNMPHYLIYALILRIGDYGFGQYLLFLKPLVTMIFTITEIRLAN